MGEWRIEGTRGVLVATDTLRLVRDGQEQTFDGLGDWNLRGALDEFLEALHEQREPKCSGRDYLNTQWLVHHAESSSSFIR